MQDLLINLMSNQLQQNRKRKRYLGEVPNLEKGKL